MSAQSALDERAVDPAADLRHMRRAIALAANGWGRVAPNPLVGAVVLDTFGSVVGEGWHAEYGGPHAEVVALAQAGERARGGTLYVTLEPCAHHGQTPPCTDAILRSGVARVVVAVRDPNPVAAGGLERLAAAGVEVAAGVAAQEAEHGNAAFLHWHRHGKPWLALKLAVSLDGRLAAERDRPGDVSGPEARAEVHRLRAGFDAILVGGVTARVDDARLTVRGPLVPRRPPLRVVLDPDARLSVGSRFARSTDDAPALLVAAHDAQGDTRALERAGVQVERVARRPAGGLDLVAVSELLAARDVRSVLCEGGGRLATSLLDADMVRRFWLVLAPKLLGGDGARAFPLRGVGANAPSGAENAIAASPRGTAQPRAWRTLRTERLGDDVLLELARD